MSTPTGTREAEAPPSTASIASKAIRWVARNLFSSPFNAVLTLVAMPVLVWLVYRLIDFVFVTARWEIIEKNLRLLLVFRFPDDQMWRVWVALGVIAASFGLAAGAVRTLRNIEIAEGRANPVPKSQWWRRIWPLLLGVVVLLAFASSLSATIKVVVIAAVTVGMRLLGRRLPVGVVKWVVLAAFLVPAIALVFLNLGESWDDWGGLMLTLTLTVTSLVAAFPLGVALAFGRRSSLPLIRWVCIGYIELVRGVPLVTFIFMAQFVVGLMVPPGLNLNLLSRVITALVIFTSAYVAEIVRGGIQSVPPGQLEAAQAIGLSPLATIRLIVLPQALRSVIPALVGQFISLFKDTSLVYIIAMTDLLRVAERITAQEDFRGQHMIVETLAFASLLYWIGSYTLSRESQRLERRLGVGER